MNGLHADSYIISRFAASGLRCLRCLRLLWALHELIPATLERGVYTTSSFAPDSSPPNFYRNRERLLRRCEHKLFRTTPPSPTRSVGSGHTVGEAVGQELQAGGGGSRSHPSSGSLPRLRGWGGRAPNTPVALQAGPTCSTLPGSAGAATPWPHRRAGAKPRRATTPSI